MYKLLLIDANNLCHKVFWTNKNLSHKGRHTGILFGFLKSLISLHKKYPDHFRVVVWDGGYERRLRESTAAVEAGLIPSVYKATRDRELTPEKEDFNEQRDQIVKLLELVRCMQVREEGFEADDIINTYCKEVVRYGGEAVIISSDKDFYQCLAPSVKIRDTTAKQTWTDERFRLEFDFAPDLWVDVGALQGEIGKSKDNIFGVDGWGPKNSCAYVHDYGTLDQVIEVVRAKVKRSKKEEKLLEQEERARLARSLKAMDVIPFAPKPRVLHVLDRATLEAECIRFGMSSILKDLWRLV